MRYAGICLVSDQVPVLVRSYSEVWRAQADGDDTHAVIRLDGTPLTLFSREAMEAMAPGSTKGAGCGCRVIEFWVEDVDAEHERLKAMGVEIVKPPISYPWGTRSVWFRDPDGSTVNFKCQVRQSALGEKRDRIRCMCDRLVPTQGQGRRLRSRPEEAPPPPAPQGCPPQRANPLSHPAHPPQNPQRILAARKPLSILISPNRTPPKPPYIMEGRAFSRLPTGSPASLFDK